MAFKTNIKYNTNEFKNNIINRFDIGSDAQYEWSRIVFWGSEPYIPFLTGAFRNRSVIASEPLFAHGELLYPGPFANYLWNGLSIKGNPLNYTQLEGRAGLSGAQWVDRARNDLIPVWIEEIKTLIDQGKV